MLFCEPNPFTLFCKRETQGEPQFFDIANYVFYLIVMPCALTKIALILSKQLGNANLGKVEFIEPANGEFLYNYLAFFFVALAIDTPAVFGVVLAITFFFTLVSRVSYFNPVLLIFGYNFYYVSSAKKYKVLLIAKNLSKLPRNFDEEKFYKRINDYTFMED